jgi:hypothetical protein
MGCLPAYAGTQPNSLLVRFSPIFLGGAALVLLLPLTTVAQAPRRHYDAQGRGFYRGPARITAGGGIALYNGDLSSGFSGNFPGGVVSAGALYPWRPHWSIGGEFAWFQLGAKDQLPERNLAFRCRSVSLVSFLRFEPLRDPGQYSTTTQQPALIRPFLQAGLGAFVYNPKAYYGTERPTEQTSFLSPERDDYAATGLMAPVGGGITFRLTEKLHLTTMATYFFTTSDQIDDVSLEHGGNPYRNDGYALVEAKLEFAVK